MEAMPKAYHWRDEDYFLGTGKETSKEENKRLKDEDKKKKRTVEDKVVMGGLGLLARLFGGK